MPQKAEIKVNVLSKTKKTETETRVFKVCLEI